MASSGKIKEKVILTCAVTGGGDTAKISPYVPVTPKEIAQSAIDAARAGASIAHIHARDPETGGISHQLSLYQEIVERIREAETDVVINITAGGGGDFIPNLEAPDRGSEGTDMQNPEERHEPVARLKPEMCSLDCGSLNFSDFVYISPVNWLRRQAELVKASGVKPELECFDTGHIRFAKQLIAEGLIEDEPFFQFCLGIPWGAEADAETIIYMQKRIPENARWSAFGLGAMQMPMVNQAALLGGNVRVGLEDNLYLTKGVLARNDQLVEKAVSILKEQNLEPMSPAETRRYLKLKKPVS